MALRWIAEAVVYKSSRTWVPAGWRKSSGARPLKALINTGINNREKKKEEENLILGKKRKRRKI
jgi:hypothetical protein